MYLCVLMNKKMHFIGMYEAYFYITLTKFIKKNFHIYIYFKYYTSIITFIINVSYYVRKHTSYTCVHTLTSNFFLKKPRQM